MAREQVAPELRLRGAEARQQHADAIVRKFHPQRPSKRLDRRFRCAILRMQGQGVIAEDGPHQHDHRIAADAQGRQCHSNELRLCVEIDVHDPDKRVGRGIAETADRPAPSRRHDQIKTAELPGRGID